MRSNGGKTILSERARIILLAVFCLFIAFAVNQTPSMAQPDTSGEKTWVYVDGINGDDTNDGKTAEAAVRTWDKAKELLGSDPGGIYVSGTISLTGDCRINLENPESQMVMRAPLEDGEVYKEVLFEVDGNAVFTDFHIDGAGGAADTPMIVINAGSLELLSNTRIENADTNFNYKGGVVWAKQGTRITVNGAAISKCYAAYGSCFFLEGAELIIYDGTFDSNGRSTGKWQYSGRGSVAYTDKKYPSAIVIHDGSFTNNKSICGGVLYVEGDSTVSIYGGLFDSNYAIGNWYDGVGGAIYLAPEVRSLTIRGGTFTNNVAERYGGAIGHQHDSKKTQIRIYNAVVTDNTADSDLNRYEGNDFGLAGGVGVCPVGSATVTTIDGAAVYGNHDDSGIGRDVTITSMSSDSAVSEYMLGGGRHNWTATESTDIPSFPGKVKTGYYSDPSDADISKAAVAATTLFRGNKSMIGGAIWANCAVFFGRTAAALEVKKADVDTGEFLSNAEFDLSGTARNGSEYKQSMSTDLTGYGIIEDIPEGDYILKETVPPDGYKSTEKRWAVKVDQEGMLTIDGLRKDQLDGGYLRVENEKKEEPHDVEISKVILGQGEELEGAVLSITGKDADGNEIEKIEWTTGTEAKKVKLPSGEYILTETSAPKGYMKAESITFTVEKDGTVKVEGAALEEAKLIMEDEEIPKINKTVNGGAKADLKAKDEEFSYDIFMTVPRNADELIITDDLVDVLEFIKTEETAVSIDGEPLSVDEQKQVLTQEDKNLTLKLNQEQIKAYAGKEIRVTFSVKIAEDADLTPYAQTGIPNEAKYNLDNTPGSSTGLALLGVPDDDPEITEETEIEQNETTEDSEIRPKETAEDQTEETAGQSGATVSSSDAGGGSSGSGSRTGDSAGILATMILFVTAFMIGAAAVIRRRLN